MNKTISAGQESITLSPLAQTRRYITICNRVYTKTIINVVTLSIINIRLPLSTHRGIPIHHKVVSSPTYSQILNDLGVKHYE